MRGICGEDLTIKEAKAKKGSGQTHNLIRFRARVIGIDVLGWNCCEKCGYNKHIEIAHKKAVSEFDENTLISIVNATDNLIALCPNYHWEYDHPNCKIESPRIKKTKQKTKRCCYCEELISDFASACLKCDREHRSSCISWPTIEVLLNMVEKSNLTQTGKQLGVSANSVKKRINKELKKNE